MRNRAVYLAVILGIILLLSLPTARGAADATKDEETNLEVLTSDEETPDEAVELEALAAPIIHACSLGSAGGSCIFDLTATANGLFKVDTKATRTGERWRVCLIEVGINQLAPCNVGIGSTTAFTGLVQKTVTSGKSYAVIVFYERPLPGTFPTAVQIRFDGPVMVSTSRQVRPLVGWYTGVHLGPNNAFAIEVREVAPNLRVTGIMVGILGCGVENHSFSLSLSPGILITTRSDGLPGFSARGLSVPLSSSHPHSLDIDGVFFNADGAGGTLEQALGGLDFVSGFSRCRKTWRATTAPSGDFDGWSDAAELRLGSNPNSLPRTPEHRIVPTTDLNGPNTCNDSTDNDGDGQVDGVDPGCR